MNANISLSAPQALTHFIMKTNLSKKFG